MYIDYAYSTKLLRLLKYYGPMAELHISLQPYEKYLIAYLILKCNFFFSFLWLSLSPSSVHSFLTPLPSLNPSSLTLTFLVLSLVHHFHSSSVHWPVTPPLSHFLFWVWCCKTFISITPLMSWLGCPSPYTSWHACRHVARIPPFLTGAHN